MIHERRPFGIDAAAGYPLFTPDLIDTMRRLLPADQHDRVAVSVTLTVHVPQEDPV